MASGENSPEIDDEFKGTRKSIPERLSSLKEKYINSGSRISKNKDLPLRLQSAGEAKSSKNSTYYRKMSDRQRNGRSVSKIRPPTDVSHNFNRCKSHGKFYRTQRIESYKVNDDLSLDLKKVRGLFNQEERDAT